MRLSIDLKERTYKITYEPKTFVSTIMVSNADIQNTLRELKQADFKEVKGEKQT
jgi:hypothetical protein